MLPKGYNPANYGGKVWWNEQNLGMRAIWGTQAEYDEFIRHGGTWEEYEAAARIRMEQLASVLQSDEENNEESFSPRTR